MEAGPALQLYFSLFPLAGRAGRAIVGVWASGVSEKGNETCLNKI